jgi:murein DD-endopeptidase MepM/ murein hydrolase activator NlpD
MKNLITNNDIVLPIPEYTDYRISSHFGMRINPVTEEEHHHDGIDIAVIEDTPVLSVQGGRIARSGWSDSLGYVVVIEHDNDVITQYAHNSLLSVAVGSPVQQGDIIAYAGSTGRSTGVHIHYEITQGLKYIDFYKKPRIQRVDPLDFYWS